MVYICTHKYADIFLRDTGFFAKYPLEGNARERINDYIMSQFMSGMDYGEPVKKFITLCENYDPKQSFEEYLKNNCVGNLYPFYCYYKHKYYMYDKWDKLKCIKFMFDFLDDSDDDFTLDFTSTLISCVCNDGLYDKKISSKIVQEVIQILVTNMAVRLAQTFYVWKNLMEYDIIDTSYYFMVNTNRCDKSLNLRIKSKRTLEDLLADSDSEISQLQRVMSAKNMKNEQANNALSMLYNNSSDLYKLFTGKSIEFIREYCAKNPDFDVMVGRFFMGKKSVAADYVLRNICRPQYYILNEFATDELKDAGFVRLDVPVEEMPEKLTIEI